MKSSLIRRFETLENRLRGGLAWSVLLTASTGSAALFMFLTHVVAVRVLSTSDYGEFSSAVALVGIVGVGASSVQAVTVRQVKGDDRSPNRSMSFRQEHLLLAIIAILIGVLSLNLIQVPISTAVLLAMWVPAAVILARANGEIQGRELQLLLHGGTTLVTLASLLVSGTLASVAPAVNIFLLGRFVVTVVFSLVLLRSLNVRVGQGLRFISPGLVNTTVVVSSMWFAANIDVLMGRAVLDEDDVGQIAVAAMLVNSVLLMPGLIAAVVYPKLVASASVRKEVIRLLSFSVGLAIVLQTVFALALLISRDFLISWLAGDGHETAIEVVFPLALAYIPLGASIVVTQFLLAVGRIGDGATFAVLVGIVAGLTAWGADGALGFVRALHMTAWLLFAGSLALVAFRLRKIHG